jgi:hypothetical protein
MIRIHTTSLARTLTFQPGDSVEMCQIDHLSIEAHTDYPPN